MNHPGPEDYLPDDVIDDEEDDQPLRRRSRRDWDPDDPDRRSPLLWLTLWLFLPALLATGLVLFGVHLGAQHPEAWYTRAVGWFVDLFY